MSCCNTPRTTDEIPPTRQKHFDINSSSNKERSKSTSHTQHYTLKDTFRCLFCGGKTCKHEDYLKHPTNSPAIPGLHSDQIDNNIFASQRPSNVLIEKFSLIKQFKEKQIGLIVNVQRPGEHPYCGPNEGLDIPSGFTYSPSLFTSEGIEVKLCGWKDMDVPESMTFMLDIVKSMHDVIQTKQKKVLVHCHAGYGRTGIAIACYKMYSEKINAEKAVKEIRAIRSKCIQSKQQMSYCEMFYSYLCSLWEIFTFGQNDLDFFLHNQNILNYGGYENDIVYNEYVPILIQYILTTVVRIKQNDEINKEIIYKAMNGTLAIKTNMNSVLNSMVDEINKDKWNIVTECKDVTLLAELLYYWLSNCVYFCIKEEHVNEVFNNKNGYNWNELTDEKKEEYVSNSFAKYELKIILYISEFLKEMKKDHDTNDKSESDAYLEKDDFRLLEEKLSTYLLGYTIDSLQSDLDKKEVVKNLIEIFDLFVKIAEEEDDTVDGEKERYDSIKYAFTNKNNHSLHVVYQKLHNFFKDKPNQLKVNESNNKTNNNVLLQSVNSMIRSMTVLPTQNNESSFVNEDLNQSEQFKTGKIASLVENGIINKVSTNVNNKGNQLLRSTHTLNMSTRIQNVNEQEGFTVLRKPWLKEEDC